MSTMHKEEAMSTMHKGVYDLDWEEKDQLLHFLLSRSILYYDLDWEEKDQLLHFLLSRSILYVTIPELRAWLPQVAAKLFPETKDKE